MTVGAITQLWNAFKLGEIKATKLLRLMAMFSLIDYRQNYNFKSQLTSNMYYISIYHSILVINSIKYFKNVQNLSCGKKFTISPVDSFIKPFFHCHFVSGQ